MADNIDIQPEFEEDRDPESSSSRLRSQSDDISQSSRSRMPSPSGADNLDKLIEMAAMKLGQAQAQSKTKAPSKLDNIVSHLSSQTGIGKKELKQNILSAWKDRRSQINENNNTLREIAAQGKHHGALASNISQGIDVTRLKGFDELVQFADNNYPGFLSQFQGLTSEDRLVSAFREGIQKPPKPSDAEILSMAMGSKDLFGDPIEPQMGDPTDFNFGANIASGGMGGGGSKGPGTTYDFPEDDQPGGFGDPAFQPQVAANKEQQKRIAEAQRRQAKIDREQAARDRLAETRQAQDNSRRISAQMKADRALSREQMSGIRSQATGARIGAYSLAAAAGLQGYVAASIADTFLIRPAEERAIRAQKDYQSKLDVYHQATRQDEIDRSRRVRDDISNRPITAVALDDYGNPIQPTTGSTAAGTGNGPGGGGTPPIGPGAPTPSNPGSGGGGPGSGGPGSGTPGQPPIIPPPIKPLLPPGGGALALATQALPAIAAVLTGAKIINSGIAGAGSQASNFATSVISGNNIQATKSTAAGVRKFLDPLGTNIVAQVAVTGFDVLLDVTQSILESIKGTEGFAPQTLQASVEGDLAKFFQQIEMARRLDPLTAELVKVNTQFELAWGELRAELLEAAIPVIIIVMNLLIPYIRGATTAADLGNTLLQNNLNSTQAGIDILQKIFAWAVGATQDKIDANLEKQLEQFFSSSNIEKDLRQRGRFPR